MNPLPWLNPPQTELKDIEETRSLNLSLYHVTGPHLMKAFVIADSGQSAIDALVRRPESLWGTHGVWEDQCQAEYLGQTMVPKRMWNHMLADMDQQFGLIITPAL